MAEAETEGILNIDEDRPFWVSWEGGYIEVGKGPVRGRDRILAYQDPEPRTVHHVTFGTGWGTTGHWEVDSFEGEARKPCCLNPCNADICIHKPWRTKGFFQFEIIINVLVSSFLFF